MRQVEQYRVFEIEATEKVTAIFRHENIKEEIRSFQAGKRHLIRFMPMQTGAWHVNMGNRETAFECIPAQPGNHGPVQTEGMRFVYADGTPYLCHPAVTVSTVCEPCSKVIDYYEAVITN